jgi:hypothetical protein
LGEQRYVFDHINKKVGQILQSISEVEQNRQAVIDKKFTDPGFVGQQYNIIIDVVGNRDKLKKKYGKAKKGMKEVRDRYNDMQVESIQ